MIKKKGEYKGLNGKALNNSCSKVLCSKSLGSLEYFLSVEGYSAEDLIRPIGSEQNEVIITESVRSSEIRMRRILKQINL